MFTENQEGASNQNAATEQSTEDNASQNSIFDGYSEIQTEDDDVMPIGDFNYQQQEAETAAAQQEQQQQNAAPEGGQENENGLDFNKKPENQEQQNQPSQEQIIEDLRKKGFAVEAPGVETVDPRLNEINQLNLHIQEGQQLLRKSDDELILEKFTDDLKKTYKNSHREHLIGTEEFNIEVQSEIAEINENKYNVKIVAENIRRNVNSYMGERQHQLNTINETIQNEKNSKAKTNREALQSQFSDFHKKGYMGVDIPANIAEEVYQSVVTGEFNKEIQNNHNLVAQFALFTRMQKEFADKLGQPTYGEGVKAAFDQINENGNNAGRNPLAQMSKQSGGNGIQGNSGEINGRFDKPVPISGKENQNGEENNANNRFS